MPSPDTTRPARPGRSGRRTPAEHRPAIPTIYGNDGTDIGIDTGRSTDEEPAAPHDAASADVLTFRDPD